MHCYAIWADVLIKAFKVSTSSVSFSSIFNFHYLQFFILIDLEHLIFLILIDIEHFDKINAMFVLK